MGLPSTSIEVLPYCGMLELQTLVIALWTNEGDDYDKTMVGDKKVIEHSYDGNMVVCVIMCNSDHFVL